eukprot:gnl/TRDRNA2_/TRDRNA2_43039_c0_seq1.p1 gnl/TRDRNA2_/TRDRNA2_43039_c0~~gnl/TRDRNA2_/TRDRNA2_43039_c0_seq1.p1  ORF type:complete len:368 (-),score=63.77 gnl/TRDRNA2_/TRDRNA2_43039_c0_seq1:196-1251(-)
MGAGGSKPPDERAMAVERSKDDGFKSVSNGHGFSPSKELADVVKKEYINDTSSVSSGRTSEGTFEGEHRSLLGKSSLDDDALLAAQAAASVPPELPLRTLLKCSPPMPVGSNRYCVRLRRASLRIPFGITFAADQSAITIAEELPHLGMGKYDELVLVNNLKPGTVDDARRLLLQSLSLELYLQKREPGGSSSWSSGGLSSFACCRPRLDGMPMTELLSATNPVATDVHGEFEITIVRRSLSQKFGVGFTAQQRGARRSAVIIISEDIPDYGLRMGDRLMSINNAPVANAMECRRFLERLMQITLLMKRPSSYSANDAGKMNLDEFPLDPVIEPMELEEEAGGRGYFCYCK